jgi:hypothetical protein
MVSTYHTQLVLQLMAVSDALMNLDMASMRKRPNSTVAFAVTFSQSIYTQIQEGRELTARQIACLERLRAHLIDRDIAKVVNDISR